MNLFNPLSTMSNLAVWFQTGGAAGIIGFLPLILIFGVFYFLLIMPQQRRQKKWQQMLGELKAGDKIATSGALGGPILPEKKVAGQWRVRPINLRFKAADSPVDSHASD